MLVMLGEHLTGLVIRTINDITDRLFAESRAVGEEAYSLYEPIKAHLEKKAAKRSPVSVFHNWRASRLLDRQKSLYRRQHELLIEIRRVAQAENQLANGYLDPVIEVLKREFIRLTELRRGMAISMGADSIVITPEEEQLGAMIGTLCEANETAQTIS